MKATEIKTIKDRKHICKFEIEQDGVTADAEGFILETTKHFLYLRGTVDFRLDGFKILPQQKTGQYKYGKKEKAFSDIMKKEGLYPEAYTYNKIQLSSFKNVFEHIKKHYGYVTIESFYKKKYAFTIGEIKRISEKSVAIRHFDATGKLDKKNTTIPYNEVLVIEFDSHYINTFKKYLKE